ncbi:MAG: DNA-directed RNA polymerase [Candidatus Omnitrophica bacterium]|nr:DNA-directed RNA polymerase [Candidatus Omnitrophota bacterium]
MCGFNQGGFKRDFGPKEMHKAVCGSCGKECEVPFKPSGDRPVYCKDCYKPKKRSY